jgi:hypothetical protein
MKLLGATVNVGTATTFDGAVAVDADGGRAKLQWHSANEIITTDAKDTCCSKQSTSEM